VSDNYKDKIIAVLRAGVKASREFDREQAFCCAAGGCRIGSPKTEQFKTALHALNKAVRATNAANALEPTP